MTESILSNLGEHLVIFFAGASGLGIIAHAVNTFPVPTSPYAKWLLGTIQYIVGQRALGLHTMNGQTGATNVTATPTTAPPPPETKG